jgi:ribosome-binding factor A
MSIRTERMARLVQREVADILLNELYEASHSMVTVTGVRVTSDLGIAYVNVSVLGENPGRRQIAFRRIEELAPQIRQALASRIRHQVRRIPEIRMFLDETAEHAQRMEDIFARLREERGEGEGEGEGAGDGDSAAAED